MVPWDDTFCHPVEPSSNVRPAQVGTAIATLYIQDGRMGRWSKTREFIMGFLEFKLTGATGSEASGWAKLAAQYNRATLGDLELTNKNEIQQIERALKLLREHNDGTRNLQLVADFGA